MTAAPLRFRNMNCRSRIPLANKQSRRCPIREPIAHYGPFVMNTRDEIVATIEDFQRGRLGIIPPDQLAPRRFS